MKENSSSEFHLDAFCGMLSTKSKEVVPNSLWDWNTS